MAYQNNLDDFNQKYIGDATVPKKITKVVDLINTYTNDAGPIQGGPKKNLNVPKTETATSTPTQLISDAITSYNNSITGNNTAEARANDPRLTNEFGNDTPNLSTGLANKVKSYKKNNTSPKFIATGTKQNFTSERIATEQNSSQTIPPEVGNLSGSKLTTGVVSKVSNYSAIVTQGNGSLPSNVSSRATQERLLTKRYDLTFRVAKSQSKTSVHKTVVPDVQKTIDYQVTSPENNLKAKFPSASNNSFIGSESKINSLSMDDAEKNGRAGNSLRSAIFLNNLIPYMGAQFAGSVTSGISSIAASKDVADGLANTISAFWGMLSKTSELSTLTSDEVASAMLADFYTIQVTDSSKDGIHSVGAKGVSIKEFPVSHNGVNRDVFNIGRKLGLNNNFSKVADITQSNMAKDLNDNYAYPRIRKVFDFDYVGYLLVIPFTSSLKARVKIPFQNTAILGAESVSAIYNNETLLHRISDLYNYTSSKREGFSLTTSYYALAPYADQNSYNEATNAAGVKITQDDNINRQMNSSLNIWSMDVIQDIQQAYRSLALPTYPNGNIQFRRPPFIKIVIGDANSNSDGSTGYVKNMLYRNQAGATNSNFYQSESHLNETAIDNTAWRTIKTFVVSAVSIDKHTGEYPYIFDDKGYPIDTMGFDVNLSLLEVAPSYMDLEPDFEAYITPIQSNSSLVV